MNKTLKTLVGGAAIALTIGLVGCTTPQQNPQNAANLAQQDYTNGKGWYSEKPHQIPSIHFAFNSTVIDPSFDHELNTLATGLKNHPRGMVTLIGHTDSTGSNSYNKQLSVKRAQAVAAYLQNQGVPASQIRVAGLGEKLPIENNGSTVGDHFNRRVDMYVMPMPKQKMSLKQIQANATKA